MILYNQYLNNSDKNQKLLFCLLSPGVIRTHDVAAVGSRLFNQDRTAVDTDVVEGADDAVGIFGQQQRLAGNFDRTNRSRLGQKMRKLSEDPVTLKDTISFCCKKVGVDISRVRQRRSFCCWRAEAIPQGGVEPLIAIHELFLLWLLLRTTIDLPDHPCRLKTLKHRLLNGPGG